MIFSYIAPIIVVTILNGLLGMVWFSSVLFGKVWARACKLDQTTLKPCCGHYIATLLGSLVMAIMFSVLVHQFKVMTLLAGLRLGFYIWLGFIATVRLSSVVWAQKPIKVYLIEIAYNLLSTLMMGAILGCWH